VLIVDDHAPFRELARSLLQRAGFTVVGEAGDGAGAVDASRRLRPHVVLLDVQLPDTDGFDVARTLADQDESPVVVLTSSRDSTVYRRRLAGSTARGFIAKAELSGAALSELIG
jgi:DNA-binding NarL/FixJ family response regulator